MAPRGGKRVGAGRPRIVEEPITFSVWVDRATLERARVVAEEDGVSLADVVRASITRLATKKPKRRKRRS
jgi:hypothetical protein